MPEDPKELVSATEQIRKFLADFEKNQKTVVAEMDKAEKRLKDANAKGDQFLRNCEELIKALTESRSKFDGVLGKCDEVKKTYTVNKEFDMIRRRFLEAEKAVQQVSEDWKEKLDAWQQNKADKQAKAAFEICDQALKKMVRSLAKLQDDSEQVIPAEMIKMARYFTDELPKYIDDYIAALNALMKELNPAKFEALTKGLP